MIVVRSFRIQNSLMTMLCLMPEVESTLIWNNSAWNPIQYFVENNWVVCLLSYISQSGSPFTLTYILTTPKRNCLDQLLMNTMYESLHRKFFKIMYIYSQSKSFDLLTSFKLETSHAHESVALKPVSTIIVEIVGKTATYFGLFLGMLSGSDINRYSSKSR